MMFVIGLVYLLIGWWSPWWVLVPLAMVVGFYSPRWPVAVRDTFVGVAGSWWVLCGILDFQGKMMASRGFAGVLGLTGGLSFVLILGLSAGLVATVAGLLGLWLRRTL